MVGPDDLLPVLRQMNRCPYCGHRCHGRTCQYHTHLTRIERRMVIFDPYPAMLTALWREDEQTRKGKAI